MKSLHLFLDLGTNAEMAVGNRERMFVSSAAAGPAFEGGQLSCGTGSIPGAVRDVRIQYGLVRYETIGRKPPGGYLRQWSCVSHFGDEKEPDDG